MNWHLTSAEDLLLDISLKAALILAAAWMLCSVCRRMSAAWRHAIWSLAIVSTLLLPALTAILPAYQVSALVPRMIASAAEQLQPQHAEVLIAWTPSDDVSALATPPNDLATSAMAEEPNTSHASTIADSPSRRSNIPWIILVWSTGVLLALLPACLGLLSLRRLKKRSTVVTSGPLLTALHQASAELGIHRPVRLLQSRDRVMPMTWGVLRPTILLPQAAANWTTDKQRIVLLHELAHLQRHDCSIQLLAQLARAIYWFNPLAWYAQRELVTLQEQACDDVVLTSGCEAPDYAEQLLSIAAGFSVRATTIGMAMAMNLENRLVIILSTQQNRRSVSRRQLVLLALMTMAMVMPLSAIQYRAASATEQAASGKQPNDAAAPGADRTQTLAELRAKIAEQYFTPVNEAQIVRGALKGMVGALGDPYSDYLTPEMLAQMESQIAGSIVGIGAQLETADKQVRVVTPLEGSPARKADVRPNDILLEIDGQPTAGLELAEVVKKIVGPAGSMVRLKIRREGKELDLAVTRDTVKLPTVKGFIRREGDRWNFLLDPAHKIAYVQLTQLGSTTPQELRTAIDSLKQQDVKGLILDLRFCPGGLLESAVATAKLFLATSTIVSLQTRGGETNKITADGSALLSEVPLIVLVNGQTASAAEVLAGALQDNQRAIVLGTRTIGKGSVQSLIKLSDGNGAVKLTTAEYRLPSGRNIDRRPNQRTWGIDPTEGYFVPLEHAKRAALRQHQQQREILGGQPLQPPASDIASWLDEQQSDPQLAKALTALAARLRTGRFAQVSDLTSAQIDQLIKREALEQRRETALKSLQDVDRELAEAGLSPENRPN